MVRMKTMLAALVLSGAALGLAPVANADEAGFLNGIRALDHYALECPRCSQDAIDVGYRACKGFDLGGHQAAVAAVRKAYNADTSSSADYYATLFAQTASYQLCPQHQNEIGPI